MEHEGHLSCLLDSQTTAGTSAPTVVSHSRKEYSFLKPNMIHEDCDKKKITMFIIEGRTWLNKTISEEEKKEEGMVYASLRSVLDSEWTQTLGRIPNIERMSYEDIVKVMLRVFLEKHPLVVQRINSLRITKEKDESISECRWRIYDGYLSAELDKAHLETLVWIHATPLHPLSL